MKKNHITQYGILAVLSVLLFSTPAFAEIRNWHSLCLKEAVETALKQNLDIRLTGDDVEIASGNVELAEGKFDEKIRLSAGFESIDNPPFTVGNVGRENKAVVETGLFKKFSTGTEIQLGWKNSSYDANSANMPINPVYDSELSLKISQPLLRGFGAEIQTGQIVAAQKGFEAAKFWVDSVSADLAANVKGRYWDLVYAWQDIEVKKISLELARKLLDETVQKIAAGRLAEVEIYQPQAEVARREEKLINAERAIGYAEDQLKLLMNCDDWLINLKPVDEPDIETVQPDPELILQNALSNRPDLLAAEKNIEAARIQEMLARDSLKPSLNLVGGIDYGGTGDSYGEAVEAITDDASTNWNVGLLLSVPLRNRAAQGSYRQALANHSKSRTAAAILRLEIKKSVRTIVRDIHLAQKAMEATRKTSIASHKRLEAEQTKFAAGRATTLDVLTAQEAYSLALSQENSARVNYAKLLAELDRIQGLIRL